MYGRVTHNITKKINVSYATYLPRSPFSACLRDQQFWTNRVTVSLTLPRPLICRLQPSLSMYNYFCNCFSSLTDRESRVLASTRGYEQGRQISLLSKHKKARLEMTSSSVVQTNWCMMLCLQMLTTPITTHISSQSIKRGRTWTRSCPTSQKTPASAHSSCTTDICTPHGSTSHCTVITSTTGADNSTTRRKCCTTTTS